MIEFEYQPYKKVIIHEITKVPLDQMILARAIAAGEGQVAQPLLWVDGVVFEHAQVPFTEDVVKAQLKGIIHWSLLVYSDMDEFKEEIVGPRATRITVFKQEGIMFRTLAKWIKENYETSI